MRHHREHLPHARIDGLRPAVGNDRRQRRSHRRHPPQGARASAVRRTPAPRAARPREPRLGRDHRAAVRHEEHDGLRRQRVPRFRVARAAARAPHHRQRGHARLRRRGDLPHRADPARGHDRARRVPDARRRDPRPARAGLDRGCDPRAHGRDQPARRPVVRRRPAADPRLRRHERSGPADRIPGRRPRGAGRPGRPRRPDARGAAAAQPRRTVDRREGARARVEAAQGPLHLGRGRQALRHDRPARGHRRAAARPRADVRGAAGALRAVRVSRQRHLRACEGRQHPLHAHRPLRGRRVHGPVRRLHRAAGRPRAGGGRQPQGGARDGSRHGAVRAAPVRRRAV